MIKINLLLAKKEKKKAGIRREIIVLIASVVFLLFVLGLLQWKMNGARDDLLLDISSKERKSRKTNL